MATSKTTPIDDPSFICIHCTTPTSSLYLTYPNKENTSLLQCITCGEISDEYQTLLYPHLLLDLMLFKARAYRHLLFNRGEGGKEERAAGRRRSLWRVGAVVIALDSYIRCANVGEPESLKPFELFARTSAYCFLETISLYGCIAISCILFQLTQRNRRPLSNIKRLPLTLLYTSLPTLSLLVISLIWRTEYNLIPSSTNFQPRDQFSSYLSYFPTLNISAAESDIPDSAYLHHIIDYVKSLSRDNLRSAASNTGNVRGWASEAVLRKGIGGSSAIVGVSVLLQFSRWRTCAALLLAWTLHLVVLHTVDPLLY